MKRSTIKYSLLIALCVSLFASPVFALHEEEHVDLVIGGEDEPSAGSHSAGTANWNTITIGESLAGTFSQTGGTLNTVGNVNVGLEAGSNGTYTMSNGRLNVGDDLEIADVGFGAFIQNGGNVDIFDNLEIGDDPGVLGTYSLNTGTLDADRVEVGERGTGIFNQNGGTLTTVTDLRIGAEPSGNGSYTMSSGIVNVGDDLDVGDKGAGIFNQTAGIVNVTHNLTVGDDTGANGTYNFSADTINVTNHLIVGNESTAQGQFNQTGGSLNVTQNVIVGDFAGSEGTYNLVDGTLTSKDQIIGNFGRGIFNHSGGTNNVMGISTFILGKEAGSEGTYTMTFDSPGGILTSVHEIIGSLGKGTFIHLAGSNTVSETLTLGELPGGIGHYTLSGIGKLGAKNEIVGKALVDSGNPSHEKSIFTQEGAASENTVSETLNLGEDLNSHGEYLLKNGKLSTKVTEVARKGIGAFFQSGGEHATTRLELGGVAGSFGTYNLTGGGILNATNASIGVEGNGTFTHIDGNHSILQKLIVGDIAGSEGEYDLRDGLLTSNDQIIGNFGKGTFVHAGGTNTVTGTTTLTLGKEAGSEGIYIMSLVAPGGTLAAKNEVVGSKGKGTFNQFAGSNTLSETLTLGEFEGGIGHYNLSSTGELSAKNEIIGKAKVDTSNASHEKGIFTQDGVGTKNTISETLTLGEDLNSQGEYLLKNGSLKAENEIVGLLGSGKFVQSAGTHEVTETLTIGKTLSVGEFHLEGGELNVKNQIVADVAKGAFINRGAKNVVSDTLIIGNAAGSEGQYDIYDDGELTANRIIVGNNGKGTFDVGRQDAPNASTVTVTNDFILGNQTTDMAQATLYRGELTANRILVGKESSASFGQFDSPSPGTAVVNVNQLIIGSSSEVVVARYDLFFGELNADSITIGHGNNPTGNNSFNHFDGTKVNVNGEITLGADQSKGVYVLSGNFTDLSSTGINIGLGAGSEGRFRQNGGTNIVAGDLMLGDDFIASEVSKLSTGAYWLTGGELVATNEILVKDRDALFKHQGGTNTVNEKLTNDGIYVLLGSSAELTAKNEVIGDTGEGVFEHVSGNHRVSEMLIVGNQSGSKGLYNLNGGTLITEEVKVGVSSEGAFVQSGGLHTVNTTISLGTENSGAGNYLLSGGAFTAFNLELGVDGEVRIGDFAQTGGSANIFIDLKINNVLSRYSLSGGSLTAGSIINDGQFNYSGGTMVLGIAGSGNFVNEVAASLNVSGGGTRTINGNLLNQTGGTINLVGTELIVTGVSPGPSANQAGEEINFSGVGTQAVSGNLLNDEGGTINVTNGTMNIAGVFTNNGAYNSDPSDNFFNDLIVGDTGYVIGGFGDNFYISNNFINNSTQSDFWDTTDAFLGFIGGGPHEYHLAAADFGLDSNGYLGNFSWGTLDVSDGAMLTLFGDAIYLDTLVLGAGSLLNLNGVNLYYDSLINNGGSYEGGEIFFLGIPEPSTMFLLGSSLLGALFRRKKYSPFQT